MDETFDVGRVREVVDDIAAMFDTLNREHALLLDTLARPYYDPESTGTTTHRFQAAREILETARERASSSVQVMLDYADARLAATTLGLLRDELPSAWAYLLDFEHTAILPRGIEAAERGAIFEPWDLLAAVLKWERQRDPVAPMAHFVRVKLERLSDVPPLEFGGIPDYLIETGLAAQAQESLWVFAIDLQDRVRSITEVIKGAYHEAAVSLPVVLSPVLLSATDRFVIAHNHPSGAAIPSPADLATTVRIRHGATAIELELVDHIIVSSRDTWTSCFQWLEEG